MIFFLPIPKICPNLLYEPMWLLYQDSVIGNVEKSKKKKKKRF